MVARLNLLLFIVMLGSLFVLSGCSSEERNDLHLFATPDKAAVSLEDYVIQPPDSVTVISSKIPEMQGSGDQVGQTQVVRPDGIISFENIGEISVAGKKPQEVAKIIADKLTEMYKLTSDYPVDVRVNNESKKYFIVGMVRFPGERVFSGHETTLSAVSRAVPNTLAAKNKIQVVRPSKDPSQPSLMFTLNFHDMIRKGNMNGNVMLEEGDLIYVPPTLLAAIGLKVQELVGPMLSGGAAVNTVRPTP